MARAPRVPPVRPQPLRDGWQILSKCMHDRGLRAAETNAVRLQSHSAMTAVGTEYLPASSSRLGPIVRLWGDECTVSIPEQHVNLVSCVPYGPVRP